ncbi:MAG: HAMP domain-containing sensor histidine kinase [Actinomycetaceae bacterium]|nr:HAMP domain-containing sensor histidine kinase [Actinomycetaceae bacterium]
MASSGSPETARQAQKSALVGSQVDRGQAVGRKRAGGGRRRGPVKRPTVRTLFFCLLPLIAGCVAAVAWWTTGERRQLLFAIELPALAALAGGAVCLVLVGGWVLRRRASAHYARGWRESDAAQSLAHRQFLRRLDHELKNPLTAIRAAIFEEGDAAASRGIIDAQSSRMSRLLTDLRKLSDLETAEIHYEEVDLEETARDAVEAVSQQLESAGESRSFVLAFPEAPWPLPHVAGDADLLYSAVYNLVSNAAKYTEPSARIEIRGSEERGSVTLVVADTGIGIPADDVQTVWEELGRAGNARGRPGYGLGLTLVATIVSRHGGSYSLDSRLGVGTQVSITLPAVAT